jgi:hypothetical protein
LSIIFIDWIVCFKKSGTDCSDPKETELVIKPGCIMKGMKKWHNRSKMTAEIQSDIYKARTNMGQPAALRLRITCHY